MLEGQVSFVKAVLDYFGTGEHGKKVDIPEFKELNQEDKKELYELLTAEGYDMLPLVEVASK